MYWDIYQRLFLLAFTALVFHVVAQSIQHINRERKIRRLGGHARKRRTWLPYGADFVWEAFLYARQNEDLLFWDRLFRKHRNLSNPHTVEVNAGGRRVVFTADPENIKAILNTQHDHYGKGKWVNKDWRAVLGYGILTTDGQQWHEGRQMIRSQLSKSRISDLRCIETHTSKLLSVLGSGRSVDVKNLFFRLTLDISTEFLFGQSALSMDSEDSSFANSLAYLQRFLIVVARCGRLGCFVSRRRFRKELDTFNSFIEPFIDKALALSPDDLLKSTEEANFNFLSSVVLQTRDRAKLRDQLTTVLIGSRDTTATTLTWLFYNLSRNREVLARLREEIAKSIGLEKLPTYEDLKAMRYLQNTIKETLRLYPPVPYNIRYALEDTTLPRGGGTDGSSPIGVLERTPIVYSVQYLHLTREHYPPTSADFPDPAIFAPHRFENWHPKHWTYLPFNGGPRICVGQQFALTEIAYVMVRILQQFDDVNWMGDRTHESVPRTPCSSEERGTDHSLVEDFMQRQKVAMKSEIVLTPDEEMRLAFSARRSTE